MSESFSTDLKIGILGGGQLGRMINQASISIGLDLFIMDSANSPCSTHTPNYTIGNIRDFDDVVKFGKDLDVITIEIENVNVEALEWLEQNGVKVFPQPSAIKLIQDKGLQKEFYEKIGVPTAPYLLLKNHQELEKTVSFLPAMQKLRKGGYDGKGVIPIKSEKDIPSGFQEPSVLEQFVDLKKELSVIISRNERGETKSFPLVEQEFNSEANLVEFLFSPANVNESLQKKAQGIAEKIIVELDMIGILAVEFFLDQNDQLYVNEVAPRPHNSGHQTIEGNYTSQFEQHLRTISGLSLGSTDIIQPSVMINLLGEKDSEGIASYEGLSEVMSWAGVYPHIYGKAKSKPFRKMGHVTVINPDINKAVEISLKVKETIKVFGK